MKLKLYIFSIILLSIATVSAQDVSFNAKVNKKKLGVNERLRIDFEVNQDGDNFKRPDFKGFKVFSGPNQSVSRSWVNGKGTYSKTFSYILIPTKRGKFTIEQAEITIKGEVYKSPPLEVTVTAAVDKPKDGNDAAYIASEKIHLVAEVSKSSPYLNQAFTVVYKLYVSPETSVSNWREIDSPKFSDFWSQNIDEKQFKIYEGEYQGEPYRYVILRRTVLYPQKTGKLNIEPLSLSVSVAVPTNRRDIFGRFLTQNANITVAAKNRTVNVKPLPLEGRPDDFTGAVGEFDFTVKTDKNSLDASEAFQLSVEANGNGNLKLFDLPKPNLPSKLEVYEPENADRVRTNLGGMSGLKRSTYTVVPAYKGKYPIPPISFSYFNPKTERYERKTSDEIVIEVMNGPVDATANINTSTAASGTNKQQVIAADKQFAYIKSTPNLQSITKKQFFKSGLFWTLLGVPFLFIPIAMIVRKKRQAYTSDVQGNRIRKADKLARKFLSEAKKNLGSQKEFYIAMERALHNYLKAKLNIQTSEMSKDRITRLLKEREVDQSTTIEFIGLLESCEFARYTPSSNVAMQQDYDKAVRVISTMDKQL
ncbi:BatD family protein [uncultured Dokdonia sp.]|uniref:BatD family protein n=1 Tax=uncultured Dokdonia sp. TaxID=575653 RepID=UPI0026382CA7|nr:BatD family protein [uncultured Dokdonia sp.]